MQALNLLPFRLFLSPEKLLIIFKAVLFSNDLFSGPKFFLSLFSSSLKTISKIQWVLSTPQCPLTAFAKSFASTFILAIFLMFSHQPQLLRLQTLLQFRLTKLQSPLKTLISFFVDSICKERFGLTPKPSFDYPLFKIFFL